MRIATRSSAKGQEDAEQPFRNFAKFFQPEPVIVGRLPDESASKPKKDNQERPRPLAGRPVREPLIILVHGTWGTKSTFAMIDKSKLAAEIRRSVPGPLEFDRHAWSGYNRVSDRVEAAYRLQATLQSKLSEANRQIFIIAHSHGGNVAMRALEGLDDDERRAVRCICLATPFLSIDQRFDIRDVFYLLPRWIQANLEGFCVFGGWIVWLLLFEVFLRGYLPDQFQFSLFSNNSLPLWKLPLVLLFFFGPAVVLFIAWQQLRRFTSQLLISSSTSPEVDLGNRVLAVTYPQDEAFQALSVVINILSLVDQLLFVLIRFAAQGSAKFKVIGWAGASPFVAMFIVLELISFGAVMAIILHSISKVVGGEISQAITIALASAYKVCVNYLWPVIELSVASIFVFIAAIGSVILFILLSLLIVAAIRIAIFILIGVLDQVRSRADFFNAAVGSVAVSMIPDGCAQTVRVPGRALFNHVKIYDDPAVVPHITRFIRTQGSA